MNSSTETLLRQLKTLAEPTRMRLLALCRQGECSVSELTRVTGLSQPRTSQHLKQLCDAGLLQRFRDGKHMYYRIPSRRGRSSGRLLDLIPDEEPVFSEDVERLWQLRGETVARISPSEPDPGTDRDIHREIVELTVTAPLGDLLDVGCGRCRIIKLLASRANRVVGLDLDSDARQLARAELMLAGIPNCSLRQGDMYRMPFGDAEFDTVILDDVVATASDPERVLGEAKRLMRAGGRLFVLQAITSEAVAETEQLVARSCAAVGLRVAPARLAPKSDPNWLLSVATAADDNAAITPDTHLQESA